MRVLRLLAVSWLFHVKQLSRSSFDCFLAICWPIFFATVAFFMFRAGGDPEALVYASLGAAVMGIWTATSVSAGSALQRERWHGTLELLVAAPTHFSLILLALAFATSAIGVYCMATTFLWGRVLFGIEIPIAPAAVRDLDSGHDPLDRRARLPDRRRVRPLPQLLGARLDDRVPDLVDLRLPRSADPASGLGSPDPWALAPTWGMRAIRESSTGGTPSLRTSQCVPGPRRDVRRDRRRPHGDRAPSYWGKASLSLDMTVSLRIFFIGGLTAYRGLINWLSPWIFFPTSSSRRSSRSCSSSSSAAAREPRVTSST